MKPAEKIQAAGIIQNALLAFSTLRDRAFRSLLTVMGVFIGVVIIIAVASTLNGFRQRVISTIEQFGTNNIYVTRFPMISIDFNRSEIRRRKQLTAADAWAIGREAPAVAHVGPVLFIPSFFASAKHGKEEMVGPEIRGAFPVMQEVMNFSLTEGRFFVDQENERREAVCVIGQNVVDALFQGRSAMGKKILLSGHHFRVIGVMDKFEDDPFGEDNPQDSIIFIPYYSFRSLYPTVRDHAITARAHTGQLQAAVDQIEEILRRRRHVPWQNDNDFEVGTSESLIKSFDKIVFAALAVMFALSTVAFLVGGVGVMNVMLASVKERTREIGVRRAIGARRRDITWQFLIEAMAMTGTGGLLGVLVGEAFMRALSAFFPMLPCETPMWARFFGFFGSVAVGLIFGLWPAIAAARLDPIKALRYE